MKPDLTDAQRAGLEALRRIGRCEAGEYRRSADQGRRHSLLAYAAEKEREAKELTAALAVLDEMLGGGNASPTKEKP